MRISNEFDDAAVDVHSLHDHARVCAVFFDIEIGGKETGRIVMDGSAEELLASDDIREFYLGQSAGDDRPEKRWKRKKTWR